MKKNGRKVFVFVNLSINSGYYGVNHGIAYLIPIVRRHSYQVSVLHLVEDPGPEEFKRQIGRLNPSIIGYSLTSPQARFLQEYSRAARDLSGVLQIAGGVGATVSPEEILLESAVDGVAIGEGEVALDRLLETIERDGALHETKGFFWRKDGNVHRNEIEPFAADLDELELPDYSLFDPAVRYAIGSPHLNVILSRGCPYSCAYCSNPVLRDVYPSQKGYTRFLSVARSMELLEGLLARFPETTGFGFEDDLLIARRNWFLSFASEYGKRIRLPYRINVRAECIDQEMVEALKESGCLFTLIGLEAGNEEFRRVTLNRSYSNSELIQKAKMIQKAGLGVFTFNMVGFPFEKRRHLRDTVRLNKKIRPNDGICTFFYPLPGTKLYQVCKREGLLAHEKLTDLPTNYNTRPLIPPTSRQKEACIKTQRKLTEYFRKRSGRAVAPSG